MEAIESEEVFFVLEEEGIESRIAAKLWGKPTGKPALLVHGWLGFILFSLHFFFILTFHNKKTTVPLLIG